MKTTGGVQRPLAKKFVFTVCLAKDGGSIARPSARRPAGRQIAVRQVAELSDLL